MLATDFPLGQHPRFHSAAWPRTHLSCLLFKWRLCFNHNSNYNSDSKHKAVIGVPVCASVSPGGVLRLCLDGLSSSTCVLNVSRRSLRCLLGMKRSPSDDAFRFRCPGLLSRNGLFMSDECSFFDPREIECGGRDAAAPEPKRVEDSM